MPYCASGLLFTATLATALTTNTPNCTAPPDNVTFVFSPPVRGTMEIIWGCFAVLVTCTWSIQHLSVPVPTTPVTKVETKRKHRLWNDAFVERVQLWATSARTLAFLEKVRFNITKLQWMGLSLLAPEYILSKALNEHLAAHESRRGFDCEEWTTTHGYFANMRGFVLRFEVAAVKMPLEPSKPSELGRKLHKPNLNGEPWYKPQNLEEAEKIELEHCRSICRVPCPNVDHRAISSSKAIEKYQKPGLEVDGQSRVTAVQKNYKLPTSSIPAGVRSETLLPQTTTNSREFPIPRTVHTTPSSLIHGGEFPSRPTTEVTSSAPISSPPTTPSTESQYPTIKSSQSQIQSEQDVLLPHVPWRGTWALSAVQLLYAYHTGIISDIPRLSIEELSDRSKGDALIKTFALVQITWLIIQIIARACQNLAVTLLEISVLAIAGCAVATYILLWHKPQDVMVPTYIDAADILTRAQVAELAARSHVSTLMVKEFWLHGVAVRVMADNIFPTTHGLPIRLTPLSDKTVYLNPVIVGFGFGGVIFGAIHLIAWNFHFPTAVEQLLWRISSLSLIAVPLLAPAGYYMTESLAARSKTADLLANKVLRPAFRVLAPLYLLARLFLLVEVFRSLAYAPASTWAQVAWPVMIPHTN
ncbi:hypothetical protein MMC17_008263 [Xylographa soralifera]|nr:hypothetical protein [Xylographa soralifera]